MSFVAELATRSACRRIKASIRSLRSFCKSFVKDRLTHQAVVEVPERWLDRGRVRRGSMTQGTDDHRNAARNFNACEYKLRSHSRYFFAITACDATRENTGPCRKRLALLRGRISDCYRSRIGCARKSA